MKLIIPTIRTVYEFVSREHFFPYIKMGGFLFFRTQVFVYIPFFIFYSLSFVVIF